MAKRLTVFQSNWLKEEQFSLWLKPDQLSTKNAMCSACNKTFAIDTMGRSALISHQTGKKHIERISTMSNSNLSSYFQKSITPNKAMQSASATKSEIIDTNNFVSSDNSTALLPCTSNSTSSRLLVPPEPYFNRADEILRAEVIWALFMMENHLPYNSCSDLSKTFFKMWPQNELIKSFSLGATKASYIVCHGIAPYVKELNFNFLRESDYFVACFDESLNKVTQSCQMDLHIRFWNKERGTVESRYFNSAFLGHPTAVNLLTAFKEVTTGVNLKKLVHVSMDGPAVNWRFLDLLERELVVGEDAADHKLLQVGSCGLHTVHNCFRTGIQKTKWPVEKILKAAYYLFKDSPARSFDFKQTNSERLTPKKFCPTRWIENLPVAERVVEMWSDLKSYIDSFNRRPVSKTPTSESFKVLKEAMGDVLILAKLEFFIYIAKVVNPFLVSFQTDAPMLPFLSEALFSVMKNLLKKFIKPDNFLQITQSVLKLVNTTLENDSFVELAKIDIGMVAERIIKEALLAKKVTEMNVNLFREECRTFLKEICIKMMKKSPLQYKLVRNIKFLDPRYCASVANSNAVCKLKEVMNLLVDTKWLSVRKCDEIVNQFELYLDTIIRPNIFEFNDDSRLDSFYYRHLGTSEQYSDLFSIVKQLLIISHGQAQVERGFSTNKQLLIENMKEHSFISQRLVCDFISSQGGALNVEIDKKLLQSVRCSSQRYKHHLEQQSAGMSTKRKLQTEEDHTYKKKRKIDLQTEINTLNLEIESLLDTISSTVDNPKKILVKLSALREASKIKSKELDSLNTNKT